MQIAPKEIMINKGDRIECKRDVVIRSKILFTQNEMYNSPETNCLTDNSGDDLFISADFLKYFYV